MPAQRSAFWKGFWRTSVNKQIQMEHEIGVRVVSYIDDVVNINARNVEDVIARIKEKMKA